MMKPNRDIKYVSISDDSIQDCEIELLDYKSKLVINNPELDESKLTECVKYWNDGDLFKIGRILNLDTHRYVLFYRDIVIAAFEDEIPLLHDTNVRKLDTALKFDAGDGIAELSDFNLELDNSASFMLTPSVFKSDGSVSLFVRVVNNTLQLKYLYLKANNENYTISTFLYNVFSLTFEDSSVSSRMKVLTDKQWIIKTESIRIGWEPYTGILLSMDDYHNRASDEDKLVLTCKKPQCTIEFSSVIKFTGLHVDIRNEFADEPNIRIELSYKFVKPINRRIQEEDLKISVVLTDIVIKKI